MAGVKLYTGWIIKILHLSSQVQTFLGLTPCNCKANKYRNFDFFARWQFLFIQYSFYFSNTQLMNYTRDFSYNSFFFHLLNYIHIFITYDKDYTLLWIPKTHRKLLNKTTDNHCFWYRHKLCINNVWMVNSQLNVSCLVTINLYTFEWELYQQYTHVCSIIYVHIFIGLCIPLI